MEVALVDVDLAIYLDLAVDVARSALVRLLANESIDWRDSR